MSLAQEVELASGVHASVANGTSGRKKLARVTEALLSLNEPLPTAALSICEILVRELPCVAARIWLYNPAFDEFDLLGQHAAQRFTDAFRVGRNRLPLDGSTAGKSFEAGTVQRAIDSLADLLNVDDPTHAPTRDVHQEAVCLVSVPIVPFAAGARGRAIGALNLFLQDGEGADLLDEESDEVISFYASTLEAALAHADQISRGRALARLNELAASLVAPDSTIGFEQRKRTYLLNVVRTILDALHANCMSMFGTNATFDTIRCLSTTGIEGHDDPSKIAYRAGEGITWEVFESGQTVNTCNVRSQFGYRGKFAERRTIAPTEQSDPFLAVPLPGETHATGVIRVLERRCHVSPTLLQNFSRYDVATLDAMAKQLGPVLRLLALHDARDLYVTRTAHQVIQPITGIIGYVSNILDHQHGAIPATVEQKLRYVRAMARASARVMQSSAWVTELKDFRFLRSLERKRTGLTAYLLERIIDMQALRRDEGIQVQLVDAERVDELGEFWADDLYFEQVLQNMIHNGVKYSYPHTTNEVRATRSGRDLVVDVSSTGLPVLPAERERIFLDRERGHHAQGYDPYGTGQGLYIARQIMEGFGGRLELLASEPIGHARPPRRHLPAPCLTTFRLLLPGAFS